MTPLRTGCHSAISDKSARGSEIQTCHSCRKTEHDTRVSVSNGLRLIRIRYGIPYAELPDLLPTELDQHLRFLLLQGQKRPRKDFPRRQVRPDSEGLVTLQRLWKRERWELAHSLASLKRNLPRGCRFHTPSQLDSWRDRVAQPSPPSSPDFLKFVRRTVQGLFNLGWDRNYESFVQDFVPRASSRLAVGSRADAMLASRGGDKEFRRNTLAGKGFDTSELRARYKEVLSAGKVRALTIFDERVDLLGPLHKMLYKHLAKFPWLLCGPPTEKRISSVCQHRFQTSVDLVAATDNLSLPVASTILECLLAKAARVPGEVRLLAVNSLPALVECGGETVQVSHGQMMGGYLSFPLLCLQSYIAASWATRGVEANILVNGDDTLISSDNPVGSDSYPPGFILNEAKTIRAQGVAEINSTCFLRNGRGRWAVVDHLRRGSFLTDFSGMQHAAAAVRSSVKWTDAFIRSRIGKKWGLSPSQLRLHPASYPGFSRNRELHRRRADTPLPTKGPALCGELLAVRGQPAEDERIALSIYLRDHGRLGARDRDEFNPSVGEIRRGFSYLKKTPRRMLTYLSHLAAIGVAREPKDELYFVPAEYVTREEDEGLRRLGLWEQGLRELADA
jgi:hypothetical protein